MNHFAVRRRSRRQKKTWRRNFSVWPETKCFGPRQFAYELLWNGNQHEVCFCEWRFHSVLVTKPLTAWLNGCWNDLVLSVHLDLHVVFGSRKPHVPNRWRTLTARTELSLIQPCGHNSSSCRCDPGALPKKHNYEGCPNGLVPIAQNTIGTSVFVTFQFPSPLTEIILCLRRHW